MKETDIDCRTVRKHTHLAGVDVEILLYTRKELIVTIKSTYKDENVEVSGSKMEKGIFCTFEEQELENKPMVVNPTKQKIIVGFLLADGLSTQDANNIKNWIGLKVSLIYDPTIKMMGVTKGGIRISPVRPVINKPKPSFAEANFANAKKAKASVETIEKNYLLTAEVKANYLAYCKKTE
jgi:hypothetical protein